MNAEYIDLHLFHASEIQNTCFCSSAKEISHTGLMNKRGTGCDKIHMKANIPIMAGEIIQIILLMS